MSPTPPTGPAPSPTDTYSTAAPQPKQSLFGIGGPLFNAM